MKAKTSIARHNISQRPCSQLTHRPCKILGASQTALSQHWQHISTPSSAKLNRSALHHYPSAAAKSPYNTVNQRGTTYELKRQLQRWAYFETMYNCRAMRKLDTTEVPEAHLVKLVSAAANQAPSGSNTQGARWIVVRDPETKGATGSAEQDWRRKLL